MYEAGFLPCQIDKCGRLITETLSSALWYIDPQRDKFKARAIRLPFASFEDYNDYKRQKKRKPQSLAVDLEEHISKLCDMREHPWFSNPKFKSFAGEVDRLIDGMQRYLSFLSQQQERNKKAHSSMEPVRSLKDTWKMRDIPLSTNVKEEYGVFLCQQM